MLDHFSPYNHNQITYYQIPYGAPFLLVGTLMYKFATLVIRFDCIQVQIWYLNANVSWNFNPDKNSYSFNIAISNTLKMLAHFLNLGMNEILWPYQESPSGTIVNYKLEGWLDIQTGFSLPQQYGPLRPQREPWKRDVFDEGVSSILPLGSVLWLGPKEPPSHPSIACRLFTPIHPCPKPIRSGDCYTNRMINFAHSMT